MPILTTNGYACACPKCGSTDLSLKGFRKNVRETKQRYGCNECHWNGTGIEYADEDVIDAHVKIARKNQKLQDQNRVERKAFRESARIANLYETLTETLGYVLDKHKFKTPKKIKVPLPGAVGVVHYSDLHMNELIDLPINKYDFKIASRRLQKYAQETIKDFKAKKVTRVVVCFGGDLLNSDRRLDEITSQATNRTQAMILAVEILQQSLQDYAKHWAIDVVWVCGNEGRVNAEIGFNNIVASDNYDHAIPMILRHLFADHKGINFHIPENPMETVFNVNGQNIVLIHGHGGGAAVPTKKAADIRSKYAERGTSVDFVIWGHIHEAAVSELFARSGSPAGANAFSDSALGLAGKASQNNYTVTEAGEISGRVVPLQKYDDYPGYEIDESLAAYNAKSLKKTHQPTKILEIVI